MALDRLNPDFLSRHLSFRGVVGTPLTPDTWWRPVFNNYDLSIPIEIELIESSSRSIKFRVTHDPQFTAYNINQPSDKKIVRPESGSTSISAPVQALKIIAFNGNKKIQESCLITQAQGFSFQVNHAEGATTPGIYLSSGTRNSPREDAGRFSMLDIENKIDPILKVVQLIEPRVTALSVVALGEMTEIHATVTGFPRKIPISLMGDGVGRILSITLSLFSCPGGIVLIDEIENGIHHSKLDKFWEIIAQASKEAKCQIIATTHNYECLLAAASSTQKVERSCFAYVRLDRKKDSDQINVVHYSGEELSEALSSEFEVR